MSIMDFVRLAFLAIEVPLLIVLIVYIVKIKNKHRKTTAVQTAHCRKEIEIKPRHTVVNAGNCTICGKPLKSGSLFLCKDCQGEVKRDAETKTENSNSGGDAN